jgi:subtilisin family serine protease
VVVNFSIGSQYGLTMGHAPMKWLLTRSPQTPGHAVVVSAGNDGARLIHASTVIGAGATESFTFTVPSYTPNSGTENDAFFFDLWCSGNLDMTATVTSPNAISYTRAAEQTGEGPVTTDGTITLWNTTSALNGHRNIQAYVHDATANVPRNGVWTLALTNNGGTSVTCHGWFISRTVGTTTVTVTGGNSERTVSMPATSYSAVTVGSYMTKYGWPSYDGGFYSVTDRTDNYSTFSSIGPTRDGRQKPDLMAPGQYISAPLSSAADTVGDFAYVQPGEKYWMMQGTSMAAPHVTGAIALLLQAGPSLTATQIKSLLTTTALVMRMRHSAERDMGIRRWISSVRLTRPPAYV